jgi:hypothetical protein
MAAKKKKVETPDVLPSTDVLELLQKHKSKIITYTLVVFTVVVIVVFYTNYTTSSEDQAWTDFSSFQQSIVPQTTVSRSDIQEIIEKTQGTSAEPWVLLFCTRLYFNQRETESALELLNRLEDKFSGHFICENDLLFQKVKRLIEEEEAWRKQNLVSAE